MRPALALLALALLVSGCHRGARAGQTGTVPRTLAFVARQTQAELQCDHVEAVLPILPGVVQVRGCGRRREYVLPPGGRRGHAAAITPVDSLAELELACSGHDLVVESPAPAVRAVSGCERRARYDLLCGRGRCAWTMTAHSGRWAGLATETPAQFQIPWELPDGVGLVGSSAAASTAVVDLETVALPPPPGAPEIPPPPPTGVLGEAEPIIPPPPPTGVLGEAEPIIPPPPP